MVYGLLRSFLLILQGLGWSCACRVLDVCQDEHQMPLHQYWVSCIHLLLFLTMDAVVREVLQPYSRVLTQQIVLVDLGCLLYFKRLFVYSHAKFRLLFTKLYPQFSTYKNIIRVVVYTSLCYL